MKASKKNVPHVASALFLSMACLSAHAATTGSWVPTKTQAFLPQLLAADTLEGVAPEASLAAHAAKATQMRSGDAVKVLVSLNLRNEAELDQFLQDLQRPDSTSYRKFLTPAQFTARFAPSEAQVTAVTEHLRQSGFVNIKVSANRLLISATGSAGSVLTGFNTSLRSFTHEGRSVYANEAPAQVPAALSGIVGSVLGLQNVVLAQTHHTAMHKVLDRHIKAQTLAAAPSGSEETHYPTEFSALYNAGSTATASQTVVGIISEGDLSGTISDLNTFISNQNLNPVKTQIVQTGPDGSSYTDTSGVGEWNLDSQTIVGAAGGAVQNLIFYTSPSMELAAITASYNRAVTDNVAKVINVSLGLCEADAHSTGTQDADENIFKQAVAQGQTFSVSTGDAGVYNCSVSRISGAPGVPKGKTYDVSEPAVSPNVIAVGGTTLYTSNGSYAGETVWNEGLAAVGIYDDAGDSDPTKRLWATGGGFSKYVAAPAWQSGITGNTRSRGLPDIAFDAAYNSGAIIIVNGAEQQVGGTSLAAPIFTGIWARLQSDNGNHLVFPAASFYKYFPSNPALIHDVTSGSNGSGSYGYKAKAGWDATTGFGSLNISKLNAFIKAHRSDFVGQ